MTDCDRARLALMESLDGESESRPAAIPHLSSCAACRDWLTQFQSMSADLRALPYPDANVDLWNAVASRIGETDPTRSLTSRLLVIGLIVLGWRALQLTVDLPLPVLHPIVPIGAAIAALWQIAGDPLEIATFAPELQKRGV
jgi:predicted anti-sigma-YlaC factor YlaD